MANIELVIKISKEDYESIKNDVKKFLSMPSHKVPVLYEAVNEGVPLPKGHGRILDEKDILDTENNDGGWYDLVDMPEYIAGVKAIIEADKEEK